MQTSSQKAIVKEIEKDFPDLDKKTRDLLKLIVENAFLISYNTCKNKEPSVAKVKAIIAQLKSFLQVLVMEL